MKNKHIAILGIVAYVLSVLASATNLDGDSTAPILLVVVSGVVLAIFVILTVVRLWGAKKKLTLAFLVSAIIVSMVPILGAELLQDGSVSVLIFNFFKILYLVTYVWVVISLFKKLNP
jgi:hypothetical protein